MLVINSTMSPPTPTANSIGTDTRLYAVSDPSIAGAWLWFGIACLSFGISLIVFETLRKRKWASIIFYTRHEAGLPEALDSPKKPFEWIHTTLRTPEKYILENAGLDAVMFLRFLWMCFSVCSLLSVCILPTILPINYFSSSPDLMDSQLFNITKNVTIGRIAMDRFSISNVPDSSYIMIFHTISAYFVCYWLFLVLHQYYRDYAELAGTYLKEKGVLAKKVNAWRQGELVQLRTIMVQNVPESLKSQEALKDWFEKLGIGQVESVVLDRIETDNIQKIAQQRDRNLFKLEHTYMKWVKNIEKEIIRRCGRLPRRESVLVQSNIQQANTVQVEMEDEQDIHDGVEGTSTKRTRSFVVSQKDYDKEKSYLDLLDQDTLHRLRPKLSFRMLQREEPGFSNTNDAIDHYTEKLQMLTSKLKQQQLLAINPSVPHSPQKPIFGSTGFVTFKSQKSAMIAAQTILHSSADLFTLQVSMAPAPQEIIWHNMHHFRKYVQSTLVSILTFLICFFMVIPTSNITSWVKVQSLGRTLGLQSKVVRGTSTTSDSFLLFCWDTLVPPIIVSTVNMGIIPYLLSYLSYFQGFSTHSQVELSTMSKYFFFLFFNIFFVFTLIWPIWTLIESIFENPMKLVRLVSTTLPTGATFFINYIILCMLAFPIELLRIFPIIYTIIHKAFIQTPRQFHELHFYTSYLNYGILYPIHVLLFVIIICYSVTSPLILLPGTIYFGVGWLIYKNQLLFVYVKEYESYGRHWILAFDRCVLGLVVFQISLAGILASKGADLHAMFLLPLIPVTLYFHRYCHLSFKLKTRVVPLDQLLPETDSECQEKPCVHPLNDPESPMASHNDLLQPDSEQAYTTPQEHLLERYPTTYLHPIFSKPLLRPWIPRVLASHVAKSKPPSSLNPSSPHLEDVEMHSIQKTTEMNYF